jgi:DNA repair exonuclease SbcCD ATPase subunit
VAKEGDAEGILALVELIAAAAVKCEDKSIFLGRIMDLEEESARELQGILEDVLGRLSSFDEGEEDQDNDDDSLEFEGEGGNDDSMASPQKLFASHGGDDSEVVKERDELRHALQDARRELASIKAEAALRDEDNEDEKKKLRGIVDDLRSRLTKVQEDLTNEEQGAMKVNRELKECMTKIHDLEDQKASLADELDVAKSKAMQLPKLEASLAAYRKKLESMGAMDQDVTSLQVQTEGYLRKIMELENENKKLPALQKSLEEAQNQAKKLEARYNEVDESLKAKDAELITVRTAATTAENAKKMYQEELNELRAQHESAAEIGSPMAALSLNNSGLSEARENAMRLEIENSNLKAQIEQFRAGESANITPEPADASAITAKDAEIKKLEGEKERLEHYTKKTLQKFQEKYLVALQDCKNKLKEKADRIEMLEMKAANEKVAQKREEKLISSAIYELGLGMMQQKLGSKR